MQGLKMVNKLSLEEIWVETYAEVIVKKMHSLNFVFFFLHWCHLCQVL